jgi:hypothetical protein
MPARVTARMAAFMPGESPPEVKIPIVLILFIVYYYIILLLVLHGAKIQIREQIAKGKP